MTDETFLQALRRNWYLMIPSVVLIALGVVLGFSPWQSDYDTKRNEGITDFMELPPNSPAARSANENFVKRPVGAGRRKRQGFELEKKYTARLEELKPGDEEYPLTVFRLGNTYYTALQDFEKAIPYFQEIVDNHPEDRNFRFALMFLADCYAKSDQRDKEVKLYQELMEKYPSDSPINKWAEQQLAMMPKQ